MRGLRRFFITSRFTFVRQAKADDQDAVRRWREAQHVQSAIEAPYRHEAPLRVVLAVVLRDGCRFPLEIGRAFEVQSALGDVACVFLRIVADFHTLSTLLIVVTLIMASSKKFYPPAYGADMVWYAI